MSRGDDRTIKYHATETDTETGVTTDINLTGALIWFTAKNKFADADASAVFQRTIANGGITVTNAIQGRFTVSIVPANTSSLGNTAVVLVYDLQVKISTGAIYTLDSGTLVVSPDVTLSTT